MNTNFMRFDDVPLGCVVVGNDKFEAVKEYVLQRTNEEYMLRQSCGNYAENSIIFLVILNASEMTKKKEQQSVTTHRYMEGSILEISSR